jgi:hypothetical protein
MFAEDLAPFFSAADFGSAALWKGSVTVNGIFDDNYVSPFGEVEANAALFTCALASVSTIAHGDAFVVGGISYTVGAVEREHGVARIRLVKS